MKKRLAIIISLIMALTIFWIPGQSAFAEGEGDQGEPTTATEPATSETTEATEPSTEEPPAPVGPFVFNGYEAEKTSVTFDWEWAEDVTGVTEVVTRVQTTKDYKDSTSSYRFDSGDITDEKTVSGLSDGTKYKYTVTAKIDGVEVEGSPFTGELLTAAPKQNGWDTVNNLEYYYQNGVKARTKTILLQRGKYKLNHYFDANGAFRGRSDAMYKKIKSMTSKTYLICIDRYNNVMCVYIGGSGKWRPYKYWSCVTGRGPRKGEKAHYTPAGTFKIKSRKYTFGGYGVPKKHKNPYSVWYCSRFTGSIFIHSQLYWRGSKSSFIPGGGVMGVNASHGCVRLYKDYSYWVYTKCAIGTKVVVIGAKKK